MNPELLQLRIEFEEFKKSVDLFYSSSTLPFKFQTAIRERLNPPLIFTGIVAPAIIPIQMGSIYINTVLAKVYIATGLTSSSDWSILN